jgi:hypothetical protein
LPFIEAATLTCQARDGDASGGLAASRRDVAPFLEPAETAFDAVAALAVLRMARISRGTAALASVALHVSGGGAGRAAKRLRRRHVLGVRAIGSSLNALLVGLRAR